MSLIKGCPIRYRIVRKTRPGRAGSRALVVVPPPALAEAALAAASEASPALPSSVCKGAATGARAEARAEATASDTTAATVASATATPAVTATTAAPSFLAASGEGELVVTLGAHAGNSTVVRGLEPERSSAQTASPLGSSTGTSGTAHSLTEGGSPVSAATAAAESSSSAVLTEPWAIGKRQHEAEGGSALGARTLHIALWIFFKGQGTTAGSATGTRPLRAVSPSPGAFLGLLSLVVLLFVVVLVTLFGFLGLFARCRFFVGESLFPSFLLTVLSGLRCFRGHRHGEPARLARTNQPSVLFLREAQYFPALTAHVLHKTRSFRSRALPSPR